MVEEKKLKYWKVVLKGTYLSLMGSPAEGRHLWDNWKEQDKAEKLRKKQLAQQAKRHSAQKD